MLAAVEAVTPDVQYVLTRTPPGEVVVDLLNGPAPQANSRTLLAVAVVTVRPVVPAVSTEVPVAGELVVR